MKLEPKHYTYGLFGLIALLIVVGFLGAFGVLKSPRFKKPPPVQLPLPTVDAQKAYDVALVRAQQWQPDALLSFLSANDSGIQVAKFIFTSQSVKGKGLSVEVKDLTVTLAEEIAYAGPAAEFPKDLISQDEAIASVKKLAGYEEAKVLGIEAVYGPEGKVWYWGVRTDKGVVSVEAKR